MGPTSWASRVGFRAWQHHLDEHHAVLMLRGRGEGVVELAVGLGPERKVIGHSQRIGDLGPSPADNVVVGRRLSVDCAFDGVAVVVDHHDDGREPFAVEGAQFLDGQLRGAVADQQHRPAVGCATPAPTAAGSV